MTLDRYDPKRDTLQNTSLLAVGLGFNNATTLLSAACDYLYQIIYEPGAVADQMDMHIEETKHLTDDFLINEVIDGKKNAIRPSTLVGPQLDYALIARVLIGAQPYIVCAGRTAAGTASALGYLARSWRDLFKQFREDEFRDTHLVADLAHERERREPGKITAVFLRAPGKDTERRYVSSKVAVKPRSAAMAA